MTKCSASGARKKTKTSYFQVEKCGIGGAIADTAVRAFGSVQESLMSESIFEK